MALQNKLLCSLCNVIPDTLFEGCLADTAQRVSEGPGLFQAVRSRVLTIRRAHRQSQNKDRRHRTREGTGRSGRACSVMTRSSSCARHVALKRSKSEKKALDDAKAMPAGEAGDLTGRSICLQGVLPAARAEGHLYSPDAGGLDFGENTIPERSRLLGDLLSGAGQSSLLTRTQDGSR